MFPSLRWGCAVLLATDPARGALAREGPRDVAAALAEVREKHGVPGLVGVTLVGDRITAQGAAGVRRRGAQAALTVADRMHLGSCTKAMTATLCALLVSQGKQRWDDRPARVFAKDVRATDAGWKDATLEMLLRNRGGAPHALDAGGLWGRLWRHPGPPRAARLALAESVLSAAPVAPPGTKYEYSNAGFSIAGAMAERAADRAYEDQMRTCLFEPLGMRTAGFGAPGSTTSLDEPRGHRADGTPVEPGPGSDNPDAIAPAGKVHASLPDWARFVSLHLRRGKGVEGPLARIDFERLHTPSEGGDYAMGWSVVTRAWGGRVLTHAGSNTTWFAVVWMAPEKGFSVLAACNQGGDAAAKACDEAAWTLIQDQQRAGR